MGNRSLVHHLKLFTQTGYMVNNTGSIDLKISAGPKTFSVNVEKLEIEDQRVGPRYRVISTNAYFNEIIGDAVVIVSTFPRASYFPKREVIHPKRHDDLLQAIYDAIFLNYHSQYTKR